MLTALRRSLARLIAPARPAARAYAGAQAGRLYADWFTAATSADAEIRGSLRRLLDRSRDLERNNDYMRGFLLSCERNINGAHRYDLRSDAGEFITRKGAAGPEWQADPLAQRAIETAWTEWGRRENCTLSRRHTWRDVRRHAVRALPRDGTVVIRKLRGPAARNRFGFALQLWEVDHLDLDLFRTRARGANEIRFGVEFDEHDAIAALWVRARHPGDTFSGAGTAQRLPIEDFYFLTLPDRPEQSVGVPWVVSAITRLRQLGAFEEAAVIAARLGASKAGFFKKTGEGGAWEGDTTTDGRAQMDVQPGTFEEMPAGWDIAQWNPEYPNIETGEFRKAMLRGICTGLGSSYITLGNDLEAVNFSSGRLGLFEEREGWKYLQLFFDEGLWSPIFADWLESAMMAGAINLPLAKFAKFNRPVFKARRWPFIDPAKEIEAAKTAIALRVTSRRQVIEDAGGDVDDVFHDNLDDERKAEAMGLSLSPPDPEPEAFGDLSKTAQAAAEAAAEEAAAAAPKKKSA